MCAGSGVRCHQVCFERLPFSFNVAWRDRYPRIDFDAHRAVVFIFPYWM
jgi:hypothetical protein